MVESRLRKIFENIGNGKIQNLFIFFLFEKGSIVYLLLFLFENHGPTPPMR